jgi:integrase
MPRSTRGRVYSRGGVWWIDFSLHGRRFRESTVARNHTAATIVLYRRISEEVTKDGRRAHVAATRDVSIAAAVALYKASREPRYHHWYAPARLAKWFGDERRLCDVQGSDIESWWRQQRTHHKGSTINADITRLSMFFRWAKREGLIASNPVRDIERPESDSKPRDGFSIDAAKRLLSALRGSDLETAYFLFLFAAFRREEAACLHWDKHVNFHSSLIQIPGTKTDDARAWLPLLEPLRTYLFVRRKDSGPVLESVGRRKDGRTDGITAQAITKRHAKWVSRHGWIPTPHQCRHATLTILLQMGVPKQMVAKFARHSSERLLDRIYGHDHAPDYAAHYQAAFSAAFRELSSLDDREKGGPTSTS